MILSYKLLISVCKQIAKKSLDEIVCVFNSVGIEVESIVNYCQPKGLKIVKILDFEKHPNADNLNVVKIEFSDGSISQVVCGAKNLKKNYWAVFAPIGTTLSNGLTIVSRDIRGVVSNGMLCACNELVDFFNTSLLPDNEKNGIILFDEKDVKDTNIDNLLNLSDIVFDISIPSNRNDLNSYSSIIQEIAPHLDIDFKLAFEFENIIYDNLINIQNNSNVCLCSGYLVVKNLSTYQIKWKHKIFLMTHGYKIYNTWVDFFNLISIIYGQPINIFDLDKITNNVVDLNISVQLPNENDIAKSISIQNIDYKIKNNSIVTYCNNKIISLASIGVVDDFAVDINSKNLLIEVANYNNLAVRKMLQEYKINTKSGNILSKPLSEWITINTFVNLLNYFKSNKVVKDATFKIPEIKGIKFNFENFNKFIGVNFKKEEIVNIFKKLNYYVSNDIVFYHPSRLDLNNEYDLYEELLKVIDINNLEVTDINVNVLDFNNSSNFDIEERIRNYFVDNGFYEVKTYNLTSKSNLKLFNFNNDNKEIKIVNPISNIREFYRFNAIDSLLNIIKYNNDRKRELKSIFEIQPFKFNDELVNTASIIFVDNEFSKIGNYERKWNIFNAKEFIKNLFTINNLKIDFRVNENLMDEVYNNQSLIIYCNDKKIGYLAVVKNSFLNYHYSIEKPCVVAFINIDLIKTKNKDIKIEQVSNLPIISRDINICLNESNNHQINQLINKIYEVDEKIVNIKIKDFFTKNDEYIYTLETTIMNDVKTLTNDEINSIVEKIMNKIKSNI